MKTEKDIIQDDLRVLKKKHKLKHVLLIYDSGDTSGFIGIDVNQPLTAYAEKMAHKCFEEHHVPFEHGK